MNTRICLQLIWANPFTLRQNWELTSTVTDRVTRIIVLRMYIWRYVHFAGIFISKIFCFQYLLSDHSIAAVEVVQQQLQLKVIAALLLPLCTWHLRYYCQCCYGCCCCCRCSKIVHFMHSFLIIASFSLLSRSYAPIQLVIGTWQKSVNKEIVKTFTAHVVICIWGMCAWATVDDRK